MSDTGFIRLKKLTGAGIILVAGRHNQCEIQAEMGTSSPIDFARSGLNYALVGGGSAKGLAQEAKRLMAEVGITSLRKDAFRAVEVVFSLPGGF